MADDKLNRMGVPVPDASDSAPRRRYVVVALAVVLIAAACVAGAPSLDARWIVGDEYLFIADNSDVTGVGRHEPLWWRCVQIFGHVHGDLYQPVPIVTYALEWTLWGEQRVLFMRQTDLLLHALNGLLLWAVLRQLLRRLQPSAGRVPTVLAWGLAMLWTLHPTLVTAYAADMGRTHVLSGTFALASLLLHLRALDTRSWPLFIAAVVALILAMMSKAVVGWIGLILVVEWALLGLRATLRSPRIYVVAAICLFFALLTLQTSKEAGLIADSQLALFGDPISRSSLAVWIYLRNVVAPLWQLSTWYLSDIHTSWSYPLVWIGVLLTATGLAVTLWTARKRSTRGVAVGLVWFAALLLPVIGVVGGRAAAAQDRYLYQPLMGLVLAVGIVVARWIAGGRPGISRTRTGIFLGLAMPICLAMLLHDRHLCHDARDTLRRAERVARLNPDDPRATENLAIARSFDYTHHTPRREHAQPDDLLERFRQTLLQAAALSNTRPEYFLGPADRAAFHRRISYQLWLAGFFEDSLEQARHAHDFEPNARLTWLRLAHAYRSLQRWNEARQAYQKLESVLTEDDPDRAMRLVEFGHLLLHRFNDPGQALEKYRQAWASPQAAPQVRTLATLGLARCEVLAGEGLRGLQLAEGVLREQPGNLESWEVIALYHLRSHHWEDAALAYAAILKRSPAHYDALRGFHEVAVQTGRYRDAALAWDAALEYAPEFRPFQAYLVWSAALAGEEAAPQMADALLEIDPNNRFACLARMLLAIRANDVEQALVWIRSARAGTALPQARELLRAAETLHVMAERQELPPEAAIAEAALRLAQGDSAKAGDLLDGYLEHSPDSRWREQVERLRREAAGGPAKP
jgi:Tfp pilus assembly protein PilF